MPKRKPAPVVLATGRSRLTVIDPPLGHTDHETPAEALGDARASIPVPVEFDGRRVVDGDGKLRALITPIDGPGRPSPRGIPSRSNLLVRVQDAELAHWRAQAEARGETISEVVRAALTERYGAPR